MAQHHSPRFHIYRPISGSDVAVPPPLPIMLNPTILLSIKILLPSIYLTEVNSSLAGCRLQHNG